VRKGGTFLRRLEKLESSLNVLSTADKWKRIRDRALEIMSEEDLEVLKAADREYQTAEQFAAMTRFNDACFTAMGEGNVRFTVSKMDLLLVEA
jgi:hypothetical protein